MVKSYKELQEELSLARKYGRRGISDNFRLNQTKRALQKQADKLAKNKKKYVDKFIKNYRKALRTGNDFVVRTGSSITIKDVLDNLYESDTRYPVLRYGNNQYYTLTNRNTNNLSDDIGTNLSSLFTNTVDVIEGLESDAEFLAHYSGADSLNKEIEILIEDKTKKKKKEGSFFKYTHNLPLDLTRYQIFKEAKSSNYTDNCFIHALKMSNVLTEAEVNSIKLMCTGDFVPLSHFKKICEALDICIITTRPKPGGTTVVTYNKGAIRVINLALVAEHYFVNEPVEVTSYAIRKYKLIKDKKDWFKFTHLNKRKPNRNISSYTLVKLLLEHSTSLLNSIDMGNAELMKTTEHRNLEKQDLKTLEYESKLCTKAVVFKPKKDDYEHHVYFDFETTTTGVKHVPMMLSKKEGEATTSYFGTDCGLQFLKSLKNNSLCIAHNLGYDIRFLIKHLYNIQIIQKSRSSIPFLSGLFYQGKKKIKITFKCSYAMIPEKLIKFGEMFTLDFHKEVMPYELYTADNISLKTVPINDALEHIKESDKELFLKNVKEWKLETDGEFKHMEYCRIYCERDVQVLKAGYEKFREWMNEITGLNTDSYVTLASLAYDFLKKDDCFEGSYALSGVPRIFIQRCVIGGRTMCSENKKIKKTNCKITDFDGVSLYPSAMARMPGFLLGRPKVVPENSDYNFLKTKTGYFVEIDVTKVGKNLKMPLLNQVNPKTKVRMFNNKLGKYYVDKTGLEDLIEFQQIEFKVLRGYYFDAGVNPKVNETITHLFNERLKMIKLENPIEKIYKLIMNASYGKSCLKEINETTQVMTKTQFESFKNNNYNHIIEYRTVDGCDKIVVKSRKPTNTHFNSCHIGVEILSMSKRIMNEVICLAEDTKIDVYYQDTDSMHIELDAVSKLDKAYRAKYKRELIGKGLGQFHEDFNFKSDERMYSVHSLFLGKKSYIDKVRLIKDGVETFSYHIRMKGIPNDVIWNKVNDEYDGDPMKLYEYLDTGAVVMFDMLDGSVKFQAESDYSIRTKRQGVDADVFCRRVSYK